ncbi:hypothetical protein PHMEG_00027619 [Phytophthora megakarya]|uniref:Uncharacterized protein n=1 Tax=Phytophthora megakarya TaxID=4795 RepID=A0A225V586_9STRA|nr:hypothetical protein PHMEG_00027619 [Phytophthora megakarya]
MSDLNVSAHALQGAIASRQQRFQPNFPRSTCFTRYSCNRFQRRVAQLAPWTGSTGGHYRVQGRQSKDRHVRFTGNVQRKPQRVVPLEVLVALPKHQGKALCMKYISVQGCRSQGISCIYEDRAHFEPASLPAVVRDHIEKHCGGLQQSVPNGEALEA